MLAIDIASCLSEAGGNVVDSVIMGEIERQRAGVSMKVCYVYKRSEAW